MANNMANGLDEPGRQNPVAERDVIVFVQAMFRSFWGWVRARGENAWGRLRHALERKPKEASLALLPLTPRYEPERHQLYFGALDKALKARKQPVLNIALTGSYGVGKSSILEEVARQHKRKVIAISLSTLGFPDGEADGASAAASTKTNRIQKEIVKQLLYSQDPVKMPGSRYRRMTRFRFWRELELAALLAVPVTLVFYLTGWTDSLAKLIPSPTEWALLMQAFVFVAAVLLILGFRAVFHNRVQIDKISAGSATISLSAKSATYFDEYLDEIVYFFEVIRRDVVIFEDIDRFDDPHIFETLRSLNSILNGAKQLRRRRIRFIYAIKDSIFDEIGARAAAEEVAGAGKRKPLNASDEDAVTAEVARSNRTKFFDLVIPVVPFITHRSARDLIVETMKDLDHKISINLIDLAARHVADMRLIKNVRNEFAIFKRQVIDTGDLELDQDKLFAMMLYKSTHLSDFELIKLGKSNLDRLYMDGRALVKANVTTQISAVRTSRTALTRVTIAADHSEALGEKLVDHLKITLFDLGGISIQHFALDNTRIETAALQTPAFWEEIANSDGTLTTTFVTRSGYQNTLNLTRAEIETALGEPISSNAWAETERTRLEAQIAHAGSDRGFLTHADMDALVGRTEFTLSRDGKDLSFAQLMKDRLKSELAVQLLSAGYIDRNFTLYTSTFYGERISANATNFILKNVDPNITDMFFPLTDGDVDDVIREKGVAVLGERSAYNVALLDRLLAHAPESAAVVASKIMTYGEEEKEFLLAYLEDGSQRDALVRHFAARWPRVLEVLVIDAQLDDASGRGLVDTALQNLSENIEYATSDAIRNYVLQNYADLSAFTSEDITVAQASRIAELVKQVGGTLADLAPLSANVLTAMVNDGSYELNRKNLLTALGDSTLGLSLDALAAANAAVYQRVLADLPEYLAALREDEATVEHGDAFIMTLVDVADANSSLLPMVIARSSEACKIAKLAIVPTAAWTALAEGHRFQVTFENIHTYLIDGVGMDLPMACILEEAGAIANVDVATEAAKLEVALIVLRAEGQLTAERRAQLVGGLSLEGCITASSIPAERGELVGRLIAEKIVADDADTFAAIIQSDISGLAFAISQSINFVDIMSTAQITPANVGELIRNVIVPRAVKDAVTDRFEEFTAGAARITLSFVAHYAQSRGKTLPYDQVARLASERVEPALVVLLLLPLLDSLSLAELSPVLHALGGKYAEMTACNGKRPNIPNTASARALVDRLRALGVVSTKTELGSELRVNMRQKR